MTGSVKIATPRPAKNDVVAHLRTKSDKIRALANAGYSRSEIANFLGIRYQFVRNVLVNDERVATGDAAQRRDGLAASAATSSGNTKLYPTPARIGSDGRVAIPPGFLAAIGLKANDAVILSLEDDSIRLMSLPASVKRVQAMVRRFIPEGVSLVDELIAERRLEAGREDDDG